MATIHVDGRAHEVADGTNLLHACLSLGFDLPYFCWHPAMGSVGACRQCAVKQFRDERDTRGRLVMACMTPASDGVRIAIGDPEAVTFRRAVVEGLMQNHPHDCPVCDEGGHCHLQDMTVMTGHDSRRYAFQKRTFRNQYLGPLVNHEMNRCIQCYRCVRFYREYAGGRDLNAFALRDVVFFGRERDGVLENEFSGNLVEVCPTGVFTDATLKHHYTRKWDLQWAPSVCVHCGLGCNTSPGERYDTLRCTFNRYHHEINGYFLCDRGRYGYGFVNSDRRVRTPLVRRDDGATESVSAEEATSRLAALLTSDQGVIGVGSPRASIEANFALRTLVGPDRFFAGVGDGLQAMVERIVALAGSNGVATASLRDVERSDAVLVLGEDVTNTAPRMALALRQSVRQAPLRDASKLKIPLWLDHAVREALQDRRGPLVVATPAATRLDEVATAAYRAAPDDIARLGFAVAHEIDAAEAAVDDLAPDESSLARQVASALAAAERPLVVSGTGCRSMPVLLAAAAVARALAARGRPAALTCAVPDCNSLGLALLRPRPFGEAVQEARAGRAAVVLVLENDLEHRAPAAAVDALLGQARHVVAIDHLHNRTTDRAEMILPAGTFAESDGTLVNNEGRAQRFFQVLDPAGGVMESWRWLRDAMTAAGRAEAAGWASLDDVILATGREMPALAAIRDAAPPASFRLAGDRVPREPGRYSGRTAMRAAISVHEPAPPADADSPLSFSMEGYRGQPPPAVTPFFWSPGWNSPQAVNKFQEEIAGPLRGDPAGVRLVGAGETGTAGSRPSSSETHARDHSVPPRFQARPDEWLVVPLHHIFGSEELSARSPAIAELAAPPHIALATADAERLGVSAGTEVAVSLEGRRCSLPVVVEPSLPSGLAGLSTRLPGASGLDLPAWARIERTA